MKILSRKSLSFGIAALLLMTVACMTMLFVGERKTAAASGVCRVVIALDRSASIGDNWTDLRGQLISLFDPANGLNRGDIEVAFWTFSHVPDTTGRNATVNYNAPYHGYVQSNDPVGKNSIENSLPEDGDDILGGQTNYAQGFGFDNGVANTKGDSADSSKPTIDAIRRQADVVAFLTDGSPNYPGGSDNNASAVSAGFAARNEYGPGVDVIGGYINEDPSSTYVPLSLYRTINGPLTGPVDTTATNIGPLGFSSLTEYLKPKILAKCNVPSADYSLIPAVTISNTPSNNESVSPGDTFNIDYTVTNNTTDGSSGSSNWKLYDVVINPGVSGNPFYFDDGSQSRCTTTINQPYCDNVPNCAAIMAMMSNNGSCNEVPRGGRGMCGTNPSTDPGSSVSPVNFTPGLNSTFYTPARCQTVEELPVGSRICSILALSSGSSTGGANRISRASCVVIAKTPLVQIHGGDLHVGRHFDDDTSTILPKTGVYTSQFRLTQDPSVIPSGRTYGSWGEYGVIAPSQISRFASLSGLAGQYGGYENSVAPNTCDLNVNVLTFANKVDVPTHDNECGYSDTAEGVMPDVESALTLRDAIDSTRYTRPLALGAGTIAGMYKDEDIGVTFDVSGGTLPRGKTVIVYVPNGTIRITGDITYEDDASNKYGSIRDIPQVVLIARDIAITEHVKRVDSWLVAMGNSSGGGLVDTCSGFVRPLSSGKCSDLLTINGPVMARQLDLWRTKVDLTGCKVVVVTDCTSVGDPAEIINLPGSAALWARGFGQNDGRAETVKTIDLPPYF